jgi:DNA-directed RNA polymerase subunit RPC12/RpoP
MHWEPCAGCGEDTIIFDLTRTKRGYFCKKCQDKVIEEIAKDPKIQEAARVFAESRPDSTAKHPLQQEFGFDKPEDGSEHRYRVRQTQVPWVKHIFYWWLHNVVAHSLIGIAPRRTFFRFHDWTSRKMHGK